MLCYFAWEWWDWYVQFILNNTWYHSLALYGLILCYILMVVLVKEYKRWVTSVLLSYCSGGCPLLTLQWRHSGHDGVSNHPRLDYVLNRLSRRRSQKISELRVTDLCVQRDSNAEYVSIWSRHQALVEKVQVNFLNYTYCHYSLIALRFCSRYEVALWILRVVQSMTILYQF